MNPAEQVLRVATGYMASSCLYAAVTLNIADYLTSGPKVVAELRHATAACADERREIRIGRRVSPHQLAAQRPEARVQVVQEGTVERRGTLGTNDALVQAPVSKQAFEDRYAALLSELAKLTKHLFVLGIPPVETRGRMTADMQKEALATIDTFNSVLPGLAQRFNAAFLALPPMPSLHTIDGVHLNSEGYRVWDKTITEGASASCD